MASQTLQIGPSSARVSLRSGAVASAVLVSWLMAFTCVTTPVQAGFLEGSIAYHDGDYEKAYAEFRKAADQGDVVAQAWLGAMYERGQGVEEDHGEAARWYRKAAEQGHEVAQYSLGLLYFQGIGVAENKVEAHKWVSLFLEQEPYSQHAWVLGAIEQHMTPMEIVEAKERARNWRPSYGK